MSMLSAQCDELRALAGDGSAEFVAGPIRASVLRMASDNIWALRNKLNDAYDEADAVRDENAKLRAENARLRELVANLIRATHPADRATLIENAAELGVEVER